MASIVEPQLEHITYDILRYPLKESSVRWSYNSFDNIKNLLIILWGIETSSRTYILILQGRELYLQIKGSVF